MNLREQYQERELRIIPGQYDLEFYKQYNYEESKSFKINHFPSEKKPDYYRWVYADEPMYNSIIYNKPSRYSKIKTMKKLGKSYHVTNRIRGVKYDDDDQFYIVTNTTENRLDIISQKYYGTPIYWWAIAHTNNIFDSLTEVIRGRKLRIPTLNNINNRYVN